MGLDPLSCYLRLPGQYPITKLELHYQKRSAKAAGFISRTLPSHQPRKTTLKNESAVNDPTDNRFDVQAPANTKRVERECDMESIFQ